MARFSGVLVLLALALVLLSGFTKSKQPPIAGGPYYLVETSSPVGGFGNVTNWRYDKKWGGHIFTIEDPGEDPVERFVSDAGLVSVYPHEGFGH